MMEKLWGNNFFDAPAKKWKKSGEGDNGQVLKRAFVAFVMDPIQKLAREVMEGNEEKVNKMLTTLEIHLKQEER